MFEIFGRHSPVFIASQVKRLASTFTRALKFDQLELDPHNIELLPLHQTVRINEHNQFLIKSSISPELTAKFVEQNPVIKELEAKRGQPDFLVHRLISEMKLELGIDSFLAPEGCSLKQTLQSLLPPLDQSSKAPLILNPKGLQPSIISKNLSTQDQFVLWTSHSELPIGQQDCESYFAIGAEIKLEVSLNRFQVIGSFGEFSVGMIRF